MAASLVPTEGGSPIALDKPIVLIGRHQECDIALQTSSKVSRRHCCIVQVGERFVLRDLGSMNGIRVNGHRIVETELCPDDEIAIADVAFTFRRDDGPARGGRAVSSARGVVIRPAQDAGSQIPVSLPEEDQSGYDPSSARPENKVKDDSHSQPAFVTA